MRNQSTSPKGINVLSFFDGMSAGQEALRQLGVPVANYYAIEIDEDAIKVTQKNFPNTVQIGNITRIVDLKKQDISSDYTFVSKITGSNLIRFVKSLPKIDLVFAGSPCQGFSVSGKTKGFEDPRSRLFFNFIQIFNAIKKLQNAPNLKFFFENVKMHKKWKDVISNHLKVEPLFIDALNYSACSRQRLYWTNLEVPTSILQKYTSDIVYSDLVLQGYPKEDQLCYVPESKEGDNDITWKKTKDSLSMCSLYYENSQGYRVSKIHKKMPGFTAVGREDVNMGLGAYAFPSGYWKDKKEFLKLLRLRKNSRKPILIKPTKKVSENLGIKYDEYLVFQPTLRECLLAMGFCEDYLSEQTDKKSYAKMLGNSWSVVVVKLLIDAYCARKGWSR